MKIQNIPSKNIGKLFIEKLARREMIKNTQKKVMQCKFFQKMSWKREKDKNNKLWDKKRGNSMKWRSKKKDKEKGNAKEKSRNKDRNKDAYSNS